MRLTTGSEQEPKRKMLKGPSPNITWNELSCKDGTPYPHEFVRDGRVFQLAQTFESVRQLYNKPITILSAYRTPTYNKKIGGARYSQHIHGRALDLKPPKGITIDKFFNDIRAVASELGIGGIGKYPTFVHIDIRLANKLIIWHGSRKTN